MPPEWCAKEESCTFCISSRCSGSVLKQFQGATTDESMIFFLCIVCTLCKRYKSLPRALAAGSSSSERVHGFGKNFIKYIQKKLKLTQLYWRVRPIALTALEFYFGPLKNFTFYLLFIIANGFPIHYHPVFLVRLSHLRLKVFWRNIWNSYRAVRVGKFSEMILKIQMCVKQIVKRKTGWTLEDTIELPGYLSRFSFKGFPFSYETYSFSYRKVLLSMCVVFRD